MFSVKVAKPVPLNAPSVDATLVALDVELEFDLPEEVPPEGLLPEALFPGELVPGGLLAGEGVVLRWRVLISSMRDCSLREGKFTYSCADRSRVPRQQ